MGDSDTEDGGGMEGNWVTRRQLHAGVTHFVARVSCEDEMGEVRKTGMVRMRFATPGVGPGMDSILDANSLYVAWELPRANGMTGFHVTTGPPDAVDVFWRPMRFQRCKFLREALPRYQAAYSIGAVGIDHEAHVNARRTYGVWALSVPPAVRDRIVRLYEAMEANQRPHGAPVVRNGGA